MKFKVYRRKFAVIESQSLTSENLMLRTLGVEQGRRVVRASLGVHTYAMKNVQSREPFFHGFCKRNFSVITLNDSQFLQLKLYKSQGKASTPYKWLSPDRLEHSFTFTQ